MALSNNVVLYAETLQTADETSANNHANPINCSAYVEGVFVLEVSQTAYGNETLDVVIETYNSYTETWHTIATFTQITTAATTQQEVITIPYGLGTSISCSWTMANMDTGKEYTLSVSGTLKS